MLNFCLLFAHKLYHPRLMLIFGIRLHHVGHIEKSICFSKSLCANCMLRVPAWAHLLQQDTDQAVASVIDDSFYCFIELHSCVLRHSAQFALKSFTDKFIERFTEKV